MRTCARACTCVNLRRLKRDGPTATNYPGAVYTEKMATAERSISSARLPFVGDRTSAPSRQPGPSLSLSLSSSLASRRASFFSSPKSRASRQNGRGSLSPSCRRFPFSRHLSMRSLVRQRHYRGPSPLPLLHPPHLLLFLLLDKLAGVSGFITCGRRGCPIKIQGSRGRHLSLPPPFPLERAMAERSGKRRRGKGRGLETRGRHSMRRN